MDETRELKKIAEGREAEMFAWNDGKILRLLRPGFNPATLNAEMQALALAHANGLPVPRSGERVDLDGRAGIVLERIDGTDLLSELGKAPWRVVPAARMCGSVHARMHSCRIDDDQFPTLRLRLETQLRSPLVPPELAEIAKRRLEQLPGGGDSLCHGDFHPANVMRSAKGPFVIDWANAARGAPEADVARTLLLLGAGEPPGYSPIMRVLTRVGRGLFIWLYVGSYMRARPLDKRQVRKWALPITVARLAEDIEPERPRLLARIHKLRVGGRW